MARSIRWPNALGSSRAPIFRTSRGGGISAQPREGRSGYGSMCESLCRRVRHVRIFRTNKSKSYDHEG